MASYRVYLLTSVNKISEAQDISCADDREALRQAAAMVGSHASVEAWSGERLVSNPYASTRRPSA